MHVKRFGEVATKAGRLPLGADRNLSRKPLKQLPGHRWSGPEKRSARERPDAKPRTTTKGGVWPERHEWIARWTLDDAKGYVPQVKGKNVKALRVHREGARPDRAVRTARGTVRADLHIEAFWWSGIRPKASKPIRFDRDGRL